MKKYISLIMASAMVASLVPATAFAADESEITASARVIGVETLNETEKGQVGIGEYIDGETYEAAQDAPELQITIESAAYYVSGGAVPEMDITVSLDNAEFQQAAVAAGETTGFVADGDISTDETLMGSLVKFKEYGSNEATLALSSEVLVSDVSRNQDEFTFTVKGEFEEGDVITVDLSSVLDSKSAGKIGTVSVDSDMIVKDDITFAKITDSGFEAGIKKIDIIAEEERIELANPIKIEEIVESSFQAGEDTVANVITLKLSKGFEFYGEEPNIIEADKDGPIADAVVDTRIDMSQEADEIQISIDGDGTIVSYEISELNIEATSARSGDVATIKIYVDGMDTVAVEVAKVVDYVVNLSVDEDDDVPVMYNGVDSDSTGLTVGDDHNQSLDITIEESFPGAWSMRDGFKFTLPEGVYVADMEMKSIDNFNQTISGSSTPVEMGEQDFRAVSATAYKNGDFESFDFKRRVFDDVNHDLTDEVATVTFELELVADPDFTGDVVFGFEGGLVDSQEVVIAKFVSPFTVEAEQNDLIIDYRNTVVDTAIVVTETEAGLWAEDNDITLSIDRGDMIQFEKDADFAVNEGSEMEIKDTTATGNKEGKLEFEVTDESYDEAAVVTITEMELFMQRSIPAGAYDLTAGSNTMIGGETDDDGYFVPSANGGYDSQKLFGYDKIETSVHANNVHNENTRAVVGNEADYSTLVHEAFVNVVTAGSDKDNTFTTKIVVPIGEDYLIAGGEQITLDAPAYISAGGHTMLPVRAVSNAIGVDSNNVIWNGDARTVTIMYGQRIITMIVGETYITVNGSAIPASSAPEITDSRAFLPLRDLAVALGVSDINWDAATKTATLNGGTAGLDSVAPVAEEVVTPEVVEVPETETVA